MTDIRLSSLLQKRARLRGQLGDMTRGMASMPRKERQTAWRRLEKVRREFAQVNRQIAALQEGRS